MKKMVMFQVAMSVYWWLSIGAFHLGVHVETFAIPPNICPSKNSDSGTVFQHSGRDIRCTKHGT
jgi:hypothetical protein